MPRLAALCAAVLCLPAWAAQQQRTPPVPAPPPPPVVPMVFPVLGRHDPLTDTFGVARGGGKRKHIGQDIMAPKLTPLVAVFDGTVSFFRGRDAKAGNRLTVRGDNGWEAVYIHLNNDTPGTDDGQGSADYAFAPGLTDGQRVVAGQFLGYVGDSGNAEEAGPHLHFELNGPNGVVNAFPSLKAARAIPEPRYPVPSPDIAPGRGELRMDGSVSLVDPVRGVFALMPVAWRNPQGKTTVQTVPDKKWVKMAANAKVYRREDRRAMHLADVPPGAAVTVVIADREDASPLLAREVAVSRLAARPKGAAY